MPDTESPAEGKFKKISALTDNWLELHKGESFDLDIICRQLEIQERDNRHEVVKKLSYEVKAGRLEKSNRIYTFIDKNIRTIDWVNANTEEVLQVKFPCDHEGESHFKFEEAIIVSPGDIHVIAGTSNMGKTAYCLNFLWENMDTFSCTLMGNEYTAAKFKRRVSHMTWAEPLKEDRTPKFELIERRGGWKDIIRPDNINIIDWLNIGENFYTIGTIIEGIQSKLNKGMALISIQKDPGKQLGRGATFSEEMSSLYLSIDFGKMTVMKCKEWNGYNPNNKMYGFDLVDAGTKFVRIREVKKCPKCWGKGGINYKCDACTNKGYVDV